MATWPNGKVRDLLAGCVPDFPAFDDEKKEKLTRGVFERLVSFRFWWPQIGSGLATLVFSLLAAVALLRFLDSNTWAMLGITGRVVAAIAFGAFLLIAWWLGARMHRSWKSALSGAIYEELLSQNVQCERTALLRAIERMLRPQGEWLHVAVYQVAVLVIFVLSCISPSTAIIFEGDNMVDNFLVSAGVIFLFCFFAGVLLYAFGAVVYFLPIGSKSARQRLSQSAIRLMAYLTIINIRGILVSGFLYGVVLAIRTIDG